MRVALAAALAAIVGLVVALVVVVTGDDDQPAPVAAAAAPQPAPPSGPGPQPAPSAVPVEPAPAAEPAPVPAEPAAVEAEPASASGDDTGQGAVASPRTADSRAQEYDPDCIKTLQHEFGCYEAYLMSVVDSQDASAALNELQRLADGDPWVLNECHPLTHSIGRYAREVYGSLLATLKYENGVCWSGLTHGALEREMFQYENAELGEAMRNMCTQDPADPYAFDYYNCVHGLGHGLAWRFNNSVFTSLPYCDELEGSWQQSSCYSGVFMQNIVTDGKMHVSQDLKPDDPMYPCTAVDTKYKTACYLMQTSYALRTVDYDYEKGFELCDGIADTDFIPTCYRSMGRDISGNHHRETGPIVEKCALGKPELEGQCIAGAVKNNVFNDHGVEKANELCNAVDPNLKTTCEQARDEAAASL